MKGPSLLLFFLLSHFVFGQNPYLEKAATFLYTDQDSAYFYLSLAEKGEIRTKNYSGLLEVYTYYNAASIQYRELPMLQKTLEKQTALISALGTDINTLSEGLYYKIYYWFDMGRYHYILSDYEKAIPFFYRILNDIEANPEPSVEEEYAYFLTASNSYLATMFRNQMKYEVAEEFYEENLRLHQKYGHEAEDLYDTKNLIASLKSAQGDFTTSNKLARESIAFYLKTDPDYYDTSFLSTSALLINNYLKTKQADSAQFYLKQAVPYTLTRPRFTTDFLYLQAKLATHEENYAKAVTFYKEALYLLEKENRNGDEQAGLLKELGELLVLQNDREQAASCYLKALALFPEAKNTPGSNDKGRANTLSNIFPVLNAYNQLLLQNASEESYKKAMSNGQAATRHLNQLRKTDFGDADKQLLVAHVLPILESSLEASFQLSKSAGKPDYTDTAFEFFEQSKSPVLLDAILRNNASHFAGIPDSLLEKERILKVTIASLEKTVQLGEEGKKSELFKEKRNYEKLIARLETAYPSYFNFKYEINTVTLKQLQQQIPAETTVLSYFCGSTAIYVLALTKNTSVFQKIPFTESDVLDLQAFQELLGTPASDLNQLNLASFTLYNKLLAPFLTNTTKTNLLIIPDGLLRTIPFEAMNTSPVKARYLVENTICSYTYSATLWVQARVAPRARPRLAAFAPDFANPGGDDPNEFLPLIGNTQEVQRIQTFFDGDTFLGKDASLDSFKQLRNDHTILHLATHAVANDETPEYSFLAFTPSKINPYLLYVNDIYALELAADLVTLSACETGVGTLQKGEGAISLARAFFYSGARSLVYTLWNINDTSSASLMDSFYANLAEGIPKDRALQEAKKSFLENNRETALAHPYYWSGFIIQGNTQPLPVRSFTFLYILGIGLFLWMLWIFRKNLLKLI